MPSEIRKKPTMKGESPERGLTMDGFDVYVEQSIGRVTFSDSDSDLHPVEVAFGLIGKYVATDGEGEFSFNFPSPNGKNIRVGVEYDHDR